MRASSFVLLLGSLLTGASAQNGANASIMLPLSTDGEFDFSLKVVLAMAGGGGAATSEVLRAASQITAGDFESYYTEFKYLADAIHDIGASVNATRFPASARESFFRSATYYRAADFFLHGNPNDTRINALWDSQLADYGAAIGLLDIPAEKLTVKSAAGFDVPVIFYPAQPKAGAKVKGKRGPACAPEKVPTVLVCSGYDGSQEELYHMVGTYVLARGWNFATYEGPGQPTVRRQQGLGFRPDWWNVVTPVVDYLLTRDDVDPARIALEGVSFGGALAPRAASREHRIAALLVNDGMTNMQTALLTAFGTGLSAVFKSGNKTLFDATVSAAKQDPTVPTSFRWVMDQGTWAFNTPSPFDFLTQLGEFYVDQAIADNITVPVWVGSAEDDLNMKGQPELAAKFYGSKATLADFKIALGAGEHCEVGAEAQEAQASLDWLADVFDAVKD